MGEYGDAANAINILVGGIVNQFTFPPHELGLIVPEDGARATRQSGPSTAEVIGLVGIRSCRQDVCHAESRCFVLRNRPQDREAFVVDRMSNQPATHRDGQVCRPFQKLRDSFGRLRLTPELVCHTLLKYPKKQLLQFLTSHETKRLYIRYRER